MPNTTVLLRIASTYFFWPTVLGLIERPRLVSTASPNTTDGRAGSSPLTMSMERPTVSAVSESPRSSRTISSSNRRATRSASACSPVMVISLPRTNTVLSKAASISLSSSSLVPSRLTIVWLPGTRTLTCACVCCATLAVRPSVRDLESADHPLVGRFSSIASPGGRRSALAVVAALVPLALDVTPPQRHGEHHRRQQEQRHGQDLEGAHPPGSPTWR